MTPHRHRPARPLRDPARRARPLAWLALLLVPALPAAAQGDALPIDRLLYADAQRQLDAADPVVRGEAALVLAASGDRQRYDDILAVAKDPAPEAAWRGLLALGYLGAPGSEIALEAQVAASSTRVQPTGVVAAFALGLLPPGSADAVVTRQLGRFQEQSFKRQRDVVQALLVALCGREPLAQRLALEQLADNPAIRDPDLRAGVLRALGRVPGALVDRVEAVLDRGTPPERSAALLALAHGTDEPDRALIPRLAKLCARDRDAAVRTAALAVLTRLRHLPALELANRMLRDDDTAAVAQATRTSVELGGHAVRRVVERQFEYLGPAGQCAVLREYAWPMSPEFQRVCRQLVAAPDTGDDLRAAATLALARAGANDVGPVVEREFLATRDPVFLRQLAQARQRLPGDPMALPPTLLDADQLAMAAPRLAALLAAGNAEASRRCSEELLRPTSPAVTAAVLHGIRTCRLPALPIESLRQLPAPLGDLLP